MEKKNGIQERLSNQPIEEVKANGKKIKKEYSRVFKELSNY